MQQASNYLDATADRLRKGPLAPILSGLLPLNSSVALDADVASATMRAAEQDEEAARAGMARLFPV